MTKEELEKSLDFVNEEREKTQNKNEKLKEKNEQLIVLLMKCQQAIPVYYKQLLDEIDQTLKKDQN